MKKKTPKFKSEDQEREFWSSHDSTEYLDWRKGKKVTLSRRRSQVRQVLYQEDLARARQQTPGEKLKIALQLSDLCLKLKKAVQNLENRHGQA